MQFIVRTVAQNAKNVEELESTNGRRVGLQ